MTNTQEAHTMISPAIHFYGNCVQAIELYTDAFGATDVQIDYYDDAPQDSGIENALDMRGKVMHSTLTICSSQINMSDTDAPVNVGNAICINVFMPDAHAVKRAHDKLKEGGQVNVPLGKQFFSPMYAAVTDRFGIRWQLIS